MEEKEYTITLFSENYSGILNRITIIFTRRKINLESIIASESEVKGIYRHTIVVHTTQAEVEKVVQQIEKQVEVIKAFWCETEEIVHREIALYKVSNRIEMKEELEALNAEYGAKIIYTETKFHVIEKTGNKQDTQEFCDKLRPFGLREFSRSGRVAINKPSLHLNQFLEELETNTLVNIKPFNN